MKQFVKYVLATVTGIILTFIVFFIFIFSVIVGVAASSKKTQPITENSILEIEINNRIVENDDDNPFAMILSGGSDFSSTSIVKITQALNSAKSDDKINGVFLKIGFFEGGFASLQEIRQQIIEFRKSGKFVYAYADIIDEKGYYLASAADSVFLNPAGDFFLNGFSSQIMYLKDALDKVGVEMQAIRVGEYKSAVEPFTNNKMSDENRVQMETYMNSLFNIFLEETAQARGKTAAEIRQLANDFSIQSAKDAAAAGLIDATFFMDEVKSQFAKRTNIKDKDLKFIGYKRYASGDDKSVTTGNRIAIIYASGEINLGQGNSESIGSASLVKTLEEIRKDDDIKSVVLRINSPGGSALASDIIWREVKLLQAKKPVIVSMGDVAASGGYYIAMPADTIIAQPATITGSIGVFLLLPNAQKLLTDKLGLHFETVKTGPLADFGSIDRPMSDKERQILQGYANRVYGDFLSRVAEGRNMDTAQVDKIARGRVWVATDAKGVNLVDLLGNMDTAISIAMWKGGIKDKTKLDIYPKPKNPFEQIMNMQGQIKANVLKNELGPMYIFWKTLTNSAKMQGAQMRLPFDFNF